MQVSFDDIVNQYYPALCYFAERTLGERPVAEEIAQDALVKYWHRQGRFQHQLEVRSFLYRTVHNAALNHLRDERVRTSRHELFLQQATTSEEDITRSIVAAEVWREINLAMNNLPEQCGRVIRMSFEEGLSTAEIAQAMGVTESTVRNQKARGILLLRKQLSARALKVLLFLF